MNNSRYMDNLNKSYMSEKIIDKNKNRIKTEEIIDEEKEDEQRKLNLYKISQNIFSKIEDSYPSNTINSTEVFRTISYSLSELKSKSQYFKKEDLLKRANFYFSLYHRINCSQINQFYNFNKYNQINQNTFCINFSNTFFPNQTTNNNNNSNNDNEMNNNKNNMNNFNEENDSNNIDNRMMTHNTNYRPSFQYNRNFNSNRNNFYNNNNMNSNHYYMNNNYNNNRYDQYENYNNNNIIINIYLTKTTIIIITIQKIDITNRYMKIKMINIIYLKNL